MTVKGGGGLCFPAASWKGIESLQALPLPTTKYSPPRRKKDEYGREGTLSSHIWIRPPRIAHVGTIWTWATQYRALRDHSDLRALYRASAPRSPH